MRGHEREAFSAPFNPFLPCVEPEAAGKTSLALSRALKRKQAWWAPESLPILSMTSGA